MQEDFLFVRDFAAIMATAGVALVLFRRLNLPSVLGYLLAGVLIGPFALPTPPVENVESVHLFAELGLIMLLFGLGLEFGWSRIRDVGFCSSSRSACSSIPDSHRPSSFRASSSRWFSSR